MNYESNPDFIKVSAYVPRTDNDGNTVTNESLGSGGVRRDDGTLSAQVRGTHIAEDSDDASLDYDPYLSPTPEAQTQSGSNTDTTWKEEIAQEVINAVAEVVVEVSAEYLKKRVVPNIKEQAKKYQDKRASKKEEKESSRSQTPTATDTTRLKSEHPEQIEILNQSFLNRARELVNTPQKMLMADMSAQRDYISAMLNIAVACKTIRKLKNVAVLNYDELEQIAVAFATQHSSEVANTILYNNTDLLNSEDQALMMSTFKGGTHIKETYKPLKYAHVENALKIHRPQITKKHSFIRLSQ